MCYFFVFFLWKCASRASAWAGETEAAPLEEKGQGGEARRRRAEGRGRNTRSGPPDGAPHGEGSGAKHAAAAKHRKASSSTNGGEGSGGGDGGGGEDGDDGDETEGATDARKKRDSMASDAQRLTSEFAAGRLAAPHFFGAMLVSERSGEIVVLLFSGGRQKR